MSHLVRKAATGSGGRHTMNATGNANWVSGSTDALQLEHLHREKLHVSRHSPSSTEVSPVHQQQKQ